MIETGELPDTDTKERTALRIIQQVLGASSLEEAFASSKTMATQTLIGVVFVINDVMLMKGEIEDATLPVYMLLDCEHEDGEKFIANTGAARAMGQALFAREGGHLPIKVTVVEVAKAKPGQSAPIGLAIV
jgi:hypothetical protein